MKFSPRDLFDRIQAVRLREGCDAQTACERAARDLAPHAADIWADCGAWLLARVEQAHARSTPFVGGGHRAGDNQDHAATIPPHTGAAITGLTPKGALPARVSSPAPAWFERVDWGVEVALPGVERKRLGDLTGRDFQVTSTIILRSAETQRRTGELAARFAATLAPEEKLADAARSGRYSNLSLLLKQYRKLKP